MRVFSRDNARGSVSGGRRPGRARQAWAYALLQVTARPCNAAYALAVTLFFFIGNASGNAWLSTYTTVITLGLCLVTSVSLAVVVFIVALGLGGLLSSLPYGLSDVAFIPVVALLGGSVFAAAYANFWLLAKAARWSGASVCNLVRRSCAYFTDQMSRCRLVRQFRI